MKDQRIIMKELGKIDQIIKKNLILFAKPGVLTVRPGYRSQGNWITEEPAIVATVDGKLYPKSPTEKLPNEVDGIAVDVRKADISLTLRLTDLAAYNQLIEAGREEYAYPDFHYERDAQTGKLLGSIIEEAMPKEQIPYTPPVDADLDAVNEIMTLTCHASPDAGWPTLREFLGNVKNDLTVGMYDFTSAHILKTVEAGLKWKQIMTLILDNPARNPSADQSNQETRNSLEAALDGRFSTAWALVKQNKAVKRWIYPTAYHIKVAVKDGSSFWLSSGNWNNSNQPEIDPISDPDGAREKLKNSNREWHIIVENEKLARTYQSFLLHDYEVASHEQSEVQPEELSIQDMLPETIEELEFEAPRKFFPPLVIRDKKICVKPLLTPDNFSKEVLALISSAKSRLYIQTQYIHPSDKPADRKHQQLIAAVRNRIDAGLDVRLINSHYMTREWLEKLKMAGIDLSKVRIQNRAHNKGIIVDSKVVALGSHNWSSQGTLRNRDATLIVHDKEAARYYESIFIHDWENLANEL